MTNFKVGCTVPHGNCGLKFNPTVKLEKLRCIPQQFKILKSLWRGNRSLSLSFSVSVTTLILSIFLFHLFLICTFAFFSHHHPFSQTRTDTHSTERKSIRHTLCQTDSTFFTQFICHSNETATDRARPSSISSPKWRFSPKRVALNLCTLLNVQVSISCYIF